MSQPKKRIPRSPKRSDTNIINRQKLLQELLNSEEMPSEKNKEEKVNYSQWLKRGKNVFIPTDNAKTVRTVEPGFYSMRIADAIGFYLFKKDLKLDELTRLSYQEYDEVLDGINKFWSRKEKFKEYGFSFKRGMLLYGPPGTGKTSLINLLGYDLINNMGGVVLTISNGHELELYSRYIPEIFRIIEPDRPIIVIIEDIDGLCESSSAETELINILDGIEQLENVVYVATTNFMEKLSKRLTNRPNRFDRRIYMGYPSRLVREQYIKFKLKPADLESINLKYWLDQTENMTISHVGELIKSVIILDNDLEESLRNLRKLSEKPKSSVEYDKPGWSDKEMASGIGFASGWGMAAEAAMKKAKKMASSESDVKEENHFVEDEDPYQNDSKQEAREDGPSPADTEFTETYESEDGEVYIESNVPLTDGMAEALTNIAASISEHMKDFLDNEE